MTHTVTEPITTPQPDEVAGSLSQLAVGALETGPILLRQERGNILERASTSIRSRPIALVGILVAGAVASRLPALRAHFWIDEAISVGIASHSWTRIPGLLRLDGSPPLYYLVLHAWMGLFGKTELATHALSLLFAAACIPVAYWGVNALFGKRAALLASLLTAANPYLVSYSSETRMYTLVVLLAMCTTLSFLQVFAFRRRSYLPMFGLSLALLLLSHNWALFFAVGTVVALVPCFLAAQERRSLIRDVILGFGGAGLLYLPWVPTLVYQVTHTGAPWSHSPGPREMISSLGAVLGDERSLVALLLGGGGALVAILKRYRTKEAAAVGSLLIIPLVTMACGWFAAQSNPGWTYRYFGIFLAPLLVLTALGLSREGRKGLVALGLILLFWLEPFGLSSGLDPEFKVNFKGDAQPVARTLAPYLSPGDVVLAMQIEELPVLRYYMGGDFRYGTVLGLQDDPGVVDWRNAVNRVDSATPEDGLIPLVDSVPVGTSILLVCPRSTGPSSRVWFRLMKESCEQWQTSLSRESRLLRRPLYELDFILQDRVKLYEKATN